MFLICFFKLRFYPETRNVEYLLRFKQLRIFGDFSQWKNTLIALPKTFNAKAQIQKLNPKLEGRSFPLAESIYFITSSSL